MSKRVVLHQPLEVHCIYASADDPHLRLQSLYLLVLNQSQSSAKLNLASDQTRQVGNSKGILQTGLDSALVAFGTRPSTETFKQIPTNFDVALLRARVDFLYVLEARVDQGGKLGKGG